MRSPADEVMRWRRTRWATLSGLLLLGSGAWADSGLVGQWTFDRAYIHGTVVSNRAAALHGQMLGPIRFSPQPDALALDGTQNYARLAAVMDTSQLPSQALSAEAWVALRAPAEWGGIIGCIQDNGSFERGWLLGYRNSSFSMAVAATGSLTYLAAPTTFTLNRWYHVVGTYDGASLKLYVNGQLAASSASQRGPIQYAPAPYVIGAYVDDNEFYPMEGYLREVCVYDRALTAAQVTEHYHLQQALFPVTVNPPEPPARVPNLGPYVRFTGPDTAVVRWQTTNDSPSILDWGQTPALGTRIEDPAPKQVHALQLTGLGPSAQYYYQIKQVVDRQVRHGEVLTLETDFNYAPPPAADLPSPYGEDALTPLYASVAQGVLAATGLRRGYCLDYGCGDGRLACELARRSELHVVGVAESAAEVVRARRALQTVGLYGSRVTILQSSLNRLPFTKDSFNLVVSAQRLTQTNTAGSPAEVLRVLRPGGGTAFLGLPPGAGGALSQWSELERWVAGSISTNQAVVQSAPDRFVAFTRAPLTGIGDWSHGYGDAAQTASSRDRRVVGRGLRLQWWGEPGPRGMLDRGNRNPSPLTINGFLFVQGNNRLWSQDAYNGSIYWALEVPGLRRVNLPRDACNFCADEQNLYVAVQDRCWRLDALAGDLTQTYLVPGAEPSSPRDWGYVASVDDRLYGSAVKPGSFYTQFDGPTYWYDGRGADAIAKVCSEALFCLRKDSGEELWRYRQGVIINSAIAIGGGRVYFVESRAPALASLATGRIDQPELWQNTCLVALDAVTGQLLWEKAVTLPASPSPVVLFLSYANEKLLVTDSTSQFYLYGYAATDGRGLWQRAYAWNRDNHGSHMYHPIIVNNTAYLEPNAVDLDTGALVRTGLPVRGGCSTMSGAANCILYVNWDYSLGSLYLWDLDTNARRGLGGSRASCWLSFISGSGMALSPTSSAGCRCRFPIQTSLGFAPP